MASERARQQQIALNRVQNRPDYEIEESKQSIIFQRGLFTKELKLPKEDSTNLLNFRTVTVKCTQRFCT